MFQNFTNSPENTQHSCHLTPWWVRLDSTACLLSPRQHCRLVLLSDDTCLARCSVFGHVPKKIFSWTNRDGERGGGGCQGNAIGENSWAEKTAHVTNLLRSLRYKSRVYRSGIFGTRSASRPVDYVMFMAVLKLPQGKARGIWRSS